MSLSIQARRQSCGKRQRRLSLTGEEVGAENISKCTAKAPGKGRRESITDGVSRVQKLKVHKVVIATADRAAVGMRRYYGTLVVAVAATGRLVVGVCVMGVRGIVVAGEIDEAGFRREHDAFAAGETRWRETLRICAARMAVRANRWEPCRRCLPSRITGPRCCSHLDRRVGLLCEINNGFLGRRARSSMLSSMYSACRGRSTATRLWKNEGWRRDGAGRPAGSRRDNLDQVVVVIAQRLEAAMLGRRHDLMQKRHNVVARAAVGSARASADGRRVGRLWEAWPWVVPEGVGGEVKVGRYRV